MKSLRLPKEIYRYEMIQQTIQEFISLAHIKIKDSDDCWEVLFSRCRFGTEKTVSEFENYLICLENL